MRRLVRRFGGYQLVLPLRLAELPLRTSVRAIVSRLRRDPRLFVFGSSLDRFADNSAYLYLYMSENCPDVTCVWISGSTEVVARLRALGLRAERRWSAAGVRASVRAGWFVVSGYLSDINRWCYDGATYVNLWHGIGVKPIERDVHSGMVAYLHRPRPAASLVARAFLDETRSPNFVLSSTDEVSRRVFCSAFDVPLQRCLPFGYPRNDHLVAAALEPAHPALVVDLALWRRVQRHPFVVGYFPTWQESDRDTEGTIPDLLATSTVLASQGGLLLYKPHVNTLSQVHDAEGLVLLPPGQDLNAYLPLCSVVITGYSSVTADFTLLNRPLLFYVSRAEEAQSTQPAVGDLADLLPGPVFRTPEEFYAALADLRNDLAPAPAIATLRRRIWNGHEGTACERLARFLCDGAAERVAVRSCDIIA